MNGLRAAGILWLLGAVMSVVVTIVFRTDVLQWVLTVASGLLAIALGGWLIIRPNGTVAHWSIALGIVWLVIFVLFTVQQAGELAAWSTDIFLAVVGVAAAVVGYAATRRLRPAGKR